MSGIATAIIGGAVVGAYAVSASAKSSSKASKEAAATQAAAQERAAMTEAGAQMEALDYLKEREKIPQELREGALQTMGGLYGLKGGIGNQQDLIQRSIDSPLYKSIMGGREAGEEAILRSASATGGLRSGDVNYNLYDYNTQLQNQALLASYNEQLMGLQGLAGLPSNAGQIASSMRDIGATQAHGIEGAGLTQAQGSVAAAQIKQQGTQQAWGNVMGMANLGIQAYGAGMFSDRRLKTNIKKIGKVKGFNFYSFDWNSVANMLGLDGSTYGCMADEVFKVIPEAVIMKNNFMFINYSTIGVL